MYILYVLSGECLVLRGLSSEVSAIMIGSIGLMGGAGDI